MASCRGRRRRDEHVDAGEALIHRPQSGRRQFQQMPVRIAEVDAAAAARPVVCAFDRDPARGEVLLPRVELILADREGDVQRPSPSWPGMAAARHGHRLAGRALAGTPAARRGPRPRRPSAGCRCRSASIRARPHRTPWRAPCRRCGAGFQDTVELRHGGSFAWLRCRTDASIRRMSRHSITSRARTVAPRPSASTGFRRKAASPISRSKAATAACGSAKAAPPRSAGSIPRPTASRNSTCRRRTRRRSASSRAGRRVLVRREDRQQDRPHHAGRHDHRISAADPNAGPDAHDAGPDGNIWFSRPK